MHKKYKKDEFTAISVALDEPERKGIREKLLKFLKEKNATFPNFQLNEVRGVRFLLSRSPLSSGSCSIARRP